MIDNFSLLLSHGLLLLMAYRLLRRTDLDCESESASDDRAAAPAARSQPRR